MTSMLDQIIFSSPLNQLPEKLRFTPYDELMVFHLEDGTYESRYHTDGKFFAPVLNNSYQRLVEYVSVHLVHPDDQRLHRELMDGSTMTERMKAASPAGVLTADIRYLALDGAWHLMRHLMISGAACGMEAQDILLYLYDVKDIENREGRKKTDEKVSQERIRGLMPDMMHENSFLSLCDELLSRSQGPWCMIAVDVKHYRLFKELNGQEKADRLLIRFGEILHEEAAEVKGYSCYRGQDDYGLCIPFDRERIERLFTCLRQEIESLSGTRGFYPILGICIVDDSGLGAVELFNRAALAAEEIKDDLQRHIRVYDPEIHERHVEEFKMLADFNSAMERGEIQFYLQPQVNVITERIVGAESLARWERPDGTTVPPMAFVPVLEKYGVVTNLDIRIWEQVCSWLKSLKDRGIRPVPVSVNVSRVDLFSMNVPEILSGLTAEYGLSTGMLKVEITESAYVDDSRTVRDMITDLRKRGFQVLMDDFGSGYSSLNMLRNISLDAIKLDAQFLRFSIGEERRGVNILESVISMTKSLATPVIVEGVETRELVRFLKDMGCRYIQGFYYYQPMPKESFETILQNPQKVDYQGIVLQRNQQIHTREFLDEEIYSDAMLNNILGPVAFYSLNGEDVDIERFNQQFVELVGLKTEVLEERRYHIQQFFHPEDRPKFFDMLREAEQDRINGAGTMIRIYKPNGSIFWMQLHVYYLHEQNGRRIFYGSCRDMTELQYISVDLPGGYYRARVTEGYELLYVSQTMLKMLGYTREDIRNRYDNQLARMIHPEDLPRVRLESQEIAEGKRDRLSPYRIRCRDGSYRYVMDQSRITDQYGELCWQSVIVDITEVMTLRNRMKLLQQYSTDCILFLRSVKSLENTEVGCYGLDEALGIGRDAFVEGLKTGAVSVTDRMGRSIQQAMETEENISACNGLYTVRPGNGRSVKCHVRFSRIDEQEQGMQCIITFSAATSE